MLARGAADDKGQLHLQLRATEAILRDARRAAGQPPVHLRGRRGVELGAARGRGSRPTASGSPPTSRSSATRASSRATCRRSRSRCAGMMYAQIDVTGSDVDLHSGGYGGVVDNPANALARIITALKGPDGRILIPGFYDDVVALTDEERALLDALPFDEEALPGAASACRRSPARSGFGVAGTQGRPADARRQRHLGRLPGRRGRRRSSRPTPTPRSAAGSSPPRIPIAIFEALRAFVEADRAARASRSAVTRLGGGRPSPDAGRPSGDPCAPRERSEATFGRRAGLHPRRRLDPGLRRRSRHDPRPAGRAPRLQPARRPRARSQRVDGPPELRDRDPHDRPDVGRAGGPRPEPSWTPRRSPEGVPSGHRERAVRYGCRAGRRGATMQPASALPEDDPS